MFYLDANLLAEKEEKFHGFLISHNQTNRKNLLTRSRTKWLNYKKWKITSARNVKEVLLVYKFISRVIR